MSMNSPSVETIDDYIRAFPADVQEVLQKVRETIRGAAPDAAEAIKYRIPTFVMGQNLVHFAACKNHLGFYPTPSALRAFAKELAAYEGAKGSVQFPFERPIPYALIRKMVAYRVKEVRDKLAVKKRAGTASRRRA